MSSYSFLDVTATIDGPGGNFSIKDGASDEGITIAQVNAKNTMTPGADSAVMHSLAASTASTITIRLLKTSPVNNQLMQLYNFQTTSAARHGKNTITVSDPTRGDIVTALTVAFNKIPDLNYAKEGGMHEWIFDAGQTTQILGTGTAEAEV